MDDDSSLDPETSAEMSDIEYLKQHHLHELVDMLIFQVSTAKPKNPAAFMAYLLRERISARDGATANSSQVCEAQPSSADESIAFSSAEKKMSLIDELSPESAFSSNSFITPSGFQKFGIWIEVQNEDVQKIIQRFHEICQENNLEPPEEFTKDTGALLRILSRASAIYFYKGFAEARAMIPLKAHKSASSSCLYLQRAITDVITFVTISQRRYFSNFMERLMDEVRLEDQGEIKETTRFWKAFRTSSYFTSLLLPRMKVYARQFDEFLHFEPYLEVYFQWLDMVIEHRDIPALDRQAIIRETYFKEALLLTDKLPSPRLPDRFALFAALVLRIIREVPEGEEFPERIFLCVQKLLFLILEDENSIVLLSNSSTKKPDSFPLRIRRADSGLVLLLSQFFNNGFRENNSERSETGTKESFHSFLDSRLGYLDKHSESFLEVSRTILNKELEFTESDNFMSKCSAYNRLRLLQYFVEAVERRHEITMNEIEMFLLRCRCFGVSIGTFFVYLSGSLQSSGLPTSVVEESKFVLSVIQEICSNASASSLLNDFSAAFLPLRECVESASEKLLNGFNGAPPFTDTSLVLLAQFLDLNAVMLSFSNAFDSQSPTSSDHYFNLSTLVATRIKVAQLQPTKCCNYVAMGLLSGIHELTEKTSTPLYTFLPACEVFAGWSPSLYFPPECDFGDGDRLVLLDYFRECMQSRALLAAIQNFLKVMPEYRPRVIRPLISYEQLQLYFFSLVVELLSLKSTNERDVLYRGIAGDLAMQGMKATDFDLFALSLTCALREPGFPEAIWNLFMAESIHQMKSFLPKLRPLELYLPDLALIVRIQKLVRNNILQRRAGLTPADKELLEHLLEKLGTEPVQDSFSPKKSLSSVEAELIALSWRLLDNLNKVEAVYHGITGVLSTSPGSPDNFVASDSSSFGLQSPSGKFFRGNSQVGRALSVLGSPYSLKLYDGAEAGGAHKRRASAIDQKAIYEKTKELHIKCKAVADHFTTFIKVVCTRNKGDHWLAAWRGSFNGNFDFFFKSLIVPDQFMQFAIGFIEILRRNSVIKHPMLRVIWSCFASCFDRMVIEGNR